MSDRLSEPDLNSFHLFLNACAIVALTYVGSHMSLNLWTAVKAYDGRVSSVEAPKKELPPWTLLWGRMFSAAFVMPTMAHLQILVLISILPYDRDKMKYFNMVVHFVLGWAGFYPLIALLTVSTEAYRLPLRRFAHPVAAPIRSQPVRQWLALALAAGASACLAVSPNVFFIQVAVLGLCLQVIRTPVFWNEKNTHTAVDRTVMSYVGWLYVAGATFLLALLLAGLLSGATSAPAPSQSPSPWDRSFLQIYGICSGCLAAFALRYESSIAFSLPETQTDTVNALLGEARDSVSSTEGTTIRIPISKRVSRFPAPLFRATLIATFMVHLPAIIFNIPFVRETVKGLASHTSPGFGRALDLVRCTPPEVWAIFMVPLSLTMDVLERPDAREVWTYSEGWITELVPHVAEDVGLSEHA